MKRLLKYYLFSSCYQVTLLFSFGAIIQSYLSVRGLSPEQISVFTVCGNAMKAAAMFVFVFFSDRLKNIPRMCAALTLPTVIFPILMFAVSRNASLAAEPIYIAACVCSAVCSFLIGLRTVIEYKLPYFVIPIEKYARLTGISGVIISIFNTGMTALFTALTVRFAYDTVISCCFAACVALLLIASAAVFSLRHEKCTQEQATEEKPKLSLAVFRLHSMRHLAIPNFVRGIAVGIYGMAAVIMLQTVTDDASVSSALALIGTAASILACLLYSWIYQKMHPTVLGLCGAALVAIGMSTMLIGRSVAAFCILYFAASFGMTLLDNSIPVYVTQIVPYGAIGGYTAIRMLLTTAGTAVGNALAGKLAEPHPMLLLILGGALAFFIAAWYFLYHRIYRRNTRPETQS